MKVSRSMAKNPWKFLLGSLVSATALSVIGITVGKFSLAVENDGWRSRQTLIANREIQAHLINNNRNTLFNDHDGSAWESLENNKKEGWTFEDRRRLSVLDGNNKPNTKERRLGISFNDCNNGDW